MGLFVPLIVQATPYRPHTEDEVLERLPRRTMDATMRELANLRAEWEQRPSDGGTTARLARRYFDLATERGDPRYVGYAEAVVNRYLGPQSAELHLVRGLIRQYRHGFAEALVELDAALAADSDLAEAQAWRGALFLVQADYVAAGAACAALEKMERPVLAASCHGLRLAYGGQLAAGESRLKQGLAASKTLSNRLWLLTRLGEAAAWAGRAGEAETHYRAALALGLPDAYLMAAWADFLLDTNRPGEVIKLLADQEVSDPLRLRLAEAQMRLKAADAERSVRQLGERFAAANQRGDTTHRAEEARYQLHLRGNAAVAARLAAENYAVQREPRDARILLEAALAARNPDLAAPALAWLKSSGFEDARLRRLASELVARP